MICITFTEEQLKQLHHWRFHHPYPRVQVKMESLLLKSQCLPHKQICHMLRINENTLPASFRDFLAGGVEKLKELNFFRRESKLAQHRQTLEAYFQNGRSQEQFLLWPTRCKSRRRLSKPTASSSSSPRPG